MATLSVIFVILFGISLWSLAKHDRKTDILGDKWGAIGMIALLLSILYGFVIMVVAFGMAWGPD